MASIDIKVPDLGSFKDVIVIDLLVKPGDQVEVDTPIATLETEKATMDVPSSAAGIVKALHIVRGGKVNSGDLVATLEGSAAVAPAAAPQAAAVNAAPAAAVVAAPTSVASAPAASVAPMVAAAPAGAVAASRVDLPPIQEAGFTNAHAGPSVRQIGRAHV